MKMKETLIDDDTDDSDGSADESSSDENAEDEVEDGEGDDVNKEINEDRALSTIAQCFYGKICLNEMF